MLILALALSSLIGVSLGLLGGGGAILTLPILTYVVGMDAKHAIASSLFVVGVTSAAGAIKHARAGRIDGRTGVVFGLAGMAGAFAGGRGSAYVPGEALIAAFVAMMLATAIAMLRGRREPATPAGRAAPPIARSIAQGLAVGLIAGLVGAGGGFLIVPALVLFGGMAMPRAIGTSLLVIAMQSFAGLAGHLTHVDLDWPMTLAVSGVAIAGSVVGGSYASRVPPEALRRWFGVFVLVMAVGMAAHLLGAF